MSRNVMAAFQINLLSSVDRPAQEGATALLMKRHDPKKKIVVKVEPKEPKAPTIEDHPHFDQLEKCSSDDTPAVMTSSEGGHSHLVFLYRRAGETSYQRSENSDSGHDHPWMLVASDDGIFALTIGDSEGHSHTVDQTALNAAFAAAALSKILDQEDDPMSKTPDTTKTAEDFKALEDNLALTRLFSGLNDGERTYFETLGDSAKQAFVGKSTDDRTDEIAKAAGNDEVIYTDLDGNEFTKADDSRMVAAAKRSDAASKETAKVTGELTQERLEKRAEAELGHLPGTAKSRAAMLHAVESIEDKDDREAAMKGLTAGNAAIGKGFETLGTEGTEDALGLEKSGPEGDLEKGIANYAKKHEIDIPEATVKYLETKEGAKLYGETLQQ